MGLIPLVCTRCGANLEVEDSSSTFTCKYCHAIHERASSNVVGPTPNSLRIMAERSLAKGEYGKAMQFIEQGLTIDPRNEELLALETLAQEGLATLTEKTIEESTKELIDGANYAEAENYYVQAQFIHAELEANIKVYGSNTATGASPANVDLALKYLDRSIQLFPNNAAYLNLYALFLWRGKKNTERAKSILEKAIQLNPRDINIQNNLDTIKSEIDAQMWLAALIALIAIPALIYFFVLPTLRPLAPSLKTISLILFILATLYAVIKNKYRKEKNSLKDYRLPLILLMSSLFFWWLTPPPTPNYDSLYKPPTDAAEATAADIRKKVITTEPPLATTKNENPSTENFDLAAFKARLCAKANSDLKEIEKDVEGQIGDQSVLEKRLNVTNGLLKQWECDKI